MTNEKRKQGRFCFSWKRPAVDDCVAFNVEFTLENEHETKEILSYYLQTMKAYENNSEITIEFPCSQFTNGHFKRGVE